VRRRKGDWAMAKVLKAQNVPDMEAFRLSSFIRRLIVEGLAETHDARSI